MIRLHFIVEGQSEEAFVQYALVDHLAHHHIYVNARRIRPRNLARSGGIISYRQLKKDLGLWMKEDDNVESYFTTMFDLYGLPRDFPGWRPPISGVSARERVESLEEAFLKDMGHSRFIPYIQLHEFESLVLVDPTVLEEIVPEAGREIQSLRKECDSLGSPEEINEGPNTSPSKRIQKHLPDFAGMKTQAAQLVSSRVGLPTLRRNCPHFNGWLEKLERLDD